MRRFVISSIIIDGYNLIGIYHKDLEKQRNQLIEALIEYHKKKGHEITVVFDGWKTGGAQENHSVIGGIRVIFSRLGEKADSVIGRIISADRCGWIVVTSDRDIATRAWASDAVPISSVDFMNAIEKIQGETGIMYEEGGEEEEEYARPSRKGNPKQMSKKEKAIRKTLNKL